MLDLHCTAAAGLGCFNATYIECLTLCAILKDFLFHYSKLSGNYFYIISLFLSGISNPIWRVSFVIGLGHKRLDFILYCQICCMTLGAERF